jgi:isoquinoline 1-oxidoreductase alpha subunit
MAIEFEVNGEKREVEVESDAPLLWVLRDELNLKGTKFGCGIGNCGACTVHINGRAIRSCLAPVSVAEGKQVTTIEGLSEGVSHPLQQAWLEHQVPQCGYCQSGMLMSAAALLAKNPKPDDAAIDQAMTNVCRCGTYSRIRAAIHTAAGTASDPATTSDGEEA